ncbi:hypothetical protein HY256_06435, partial [Candidatus Sumerlaeota bacterium]|nr:hypothetical protein [Candidatus Sumerlaeota bacterium]
WFGGNSTNSDNQHLADSGHMSFVTTMTCNTGAIDYPVPKGLPGGGWNICISEDMMRVKNGGAIALYVPSGPSVTGIQHAMSLQLHGAMFGDHFRRLGEMIALSGARYIAAGNQRELAYMLILLGDPALDLELTQNLRTCPPPSKFYRPRDSIQFTLADIQPPAGKFTAALVSDAKGAGGRVLARRLCGGAETPYADGRIPVDLSVPFDAPLGPAHLQLYAWDERTTRDLAVSADFEIAQPKLEILNARSVIAEDGNTRVKVEIANRGPIPAREERIELTLPGGEQTSGAAPALFSVDASSSTTLEIPVNLFGKDTPRRPRLLDVRLATSFPPADDLPYDAIFRRLAILPPRESSGDVWAGLMPGLSDWTSPPDPSPAKLKVAAVLPLATDHPTTSRFNVALLDALGNPITQQPIIPREGISETEFELSGELRERAGLGTIKLKLGEGQTSPSLALDSVGVAEIPHNFARLRIRPESVRIEPENPFDGQTILVDFEVENA